MWDNFLLPGERVDGTGFGQLKLIQKPEEFCYGVDAVLLADFAAKAARGGSAVMKAVDLGTGTGIIPLILSHKTSLNQIYAVEVQQPSFERACRNVELNGLKERIVVVREDVLHVETNLSHWKGTFDLVTTNPPYMIGGAGLTNGNSAKTTARHETTAGLEDFIRTAASLLRDKGQLFMVHRPSRLVDICEACRRYKVEPKELRFVSPNKNTKPNILLIRCVKGGNRELKLLEPLYVYEEDGSRYTEELINIYER
ncbi:tRNA1(Val) (adenine(37)-N6)-methyltransferase [Aminipila butyrica]|uniref:tRNA1(Val) (Adenine(37)-N6)-methyltransferase n=1 Tax=Aminipila butyrica TaxID=433296 RepID=A0A858BVP1_9FIRM|nr:tRNA1(Val) (adenine(37)-N6)-methyltransferase [Aminipila butyrica]QIB70121.1 tRNA1(Val) (adenine(37)-N6)-methyltransferase [Aminipila butyrica]